MVAMAACLGTVAGASLLSPADAGAQGGRAAGGPTTTVASASPVATPGVDQYGGSTARQLEATGRFRTARVDGRWWLIDPDGHPFFSNGMSALNYGEVPTDQARYGSPAAWAKGTTKLLRSWNVNTIGGWSERYLPVYADGHLPFTFVLEMTNRPDDVFSPTWEKRVRSTIDTATRAHGDDPDLIGYYVDNELPWLLDLSDNFASQLQSYLQLPGSARGKAEVTTFLKARYRGDLAALRRDVPSIKATSWPALKASTAKVESPTTPAGRKTLTAWTTHVAKRYFSFVGATLRKADPDHLNLGPRFVSQLTPKAVIVEAAKHIDVLAVNFYENLPEWDRAAQGFANGYDMAWTGAMLADFAKLSRKPLLISEWGYRAAGTGLPNTIPPSMVTAKDQTQRAAWVRNYLSCALDTNYVVGAHWFQFADQPKAGRGGDGENNNWGVMNKDGKVYTKVTDELAKVPARAYGRLSSGAKPLPCKPVGLQR